MEGKKIFVSHISNKELEAKINMKFNPKARK
jgi:hypothetical protein